MSTATTMTTRYPGNRTATEVATYAIKHVVCPNCSAQAGVECSAGAPGWICKPRFAAACVALKKLDPEEPQPRATRTRCDGGPSCPSHPKLAVARADALRAQAEGRRLRGQLAEAQARIAQLYRTRSPGDEYLNGLDPKVYGLLKLALGTDETDEAQAAFTKARTLFQAGG